MTKKIDLSKSTVEQDPYLKDKPDVQVEIVGEKQPSTRKNLSIEELTKPH